MWLNVLKAFLMGGVICTLGQILINLTHLTNGKILVTFLVAGAVLQAFNLYQPLIDMFGAGASVRASATACGWPAVGSAPSSGAYTTSVPPPRLTPQRMSRTPLSHVVVMSP